MSCSKMEWTSTDLLLFSKEQRRIQENKIKSWNSILSSLRAPISCCTRKKIWSDAVHLNQNLRQAPQEIKFYLLPGLLFHKARSIMF